PGAVIAEGEKAAGLEFRTDGTAAEGPATVSVVATVEDKEIDRKNVTLIVPAPPPVRPETGNRPRAVPLCTADDCRGHGESTAVGKEFAGYLCIGFRRSRILS